MTSGSSKVEEAVDCYLRAANLFKMAKKWAQAGNAFCSAANLHLKAGVRHDAATNFVDASNCYKKCDPNGKYKCTSFRLGFVQNRTHRFIKQRLLIVNYTASGLYCNIYSQIDLRLTLRS